MKRGVTDTKIKYNLEKTHSLIKRNYFSSVYNKLSGICSSLKIFIIKSYTEGQFFRLAGTRHIKHFPEKFREP
jgi:hypothetical protein